jgi:hypothetical protein
VISVAVRELRLLLGLLLILFVTSETWRWVGRLTAPRLILFVLVVIAAALLVVIVGLRWTVERPAVRPATMRVASEIIAFGGLLFITFTLVGLMSVDAELVVDWSGADNGVLTSLPVGNPPLVLTRQLLQVTAFLAALGTLTFAVEIIADSSTRHSLIHDLVEPAGHVGVTAAAPPTTMVQ